MTESRFEGEGPVGRYWLANCEGFVVTGGAHGVVEGLIRDFDPHVTTRLVVRTRMRRRRVLPASKVVEVVPAEQLLVVERRERELSLPSVAPAASLVTGAAVSVGHHIGHAVEASRPRAHTLASSSRSRVHAVAVAAAPRVSGVAPRVNAVLRRIGASLVGSFRSLAAEARAFGPALRRRG